MSQKLICSDGSMIDFSDTDELFAIPPQFADPALPQGQPLSRLELHEQREIWPEPISCDTHCKREAARLVQDQISFIRQNIGKWLDENKQ